VGSHVASSRPRSQEWAAHFAPLLPTAHLFGSAANGLALSNDAGWLSAAPAAGAGGARVGKPTDVDVCLVVPTEGVKEYFHRRAADRAGAAPRGRRRRRQKADHESNVQLLKATAEGLKALRGAGGLQWAASIYHARIPLLQLRWHPTGAEVDVAVDNMLPLANSTLLRTYAGMDARLHAVVLSWKAITKARRLASAADDHTISSYAWCLLVVAFFQLLGLLPSVQDVRMVADYRAAVDDGLPTTADHARWAGFTTALALDAAGEETAAAGDAADAAATFHTAFVADPVFARSWARDNDVLSAALTSDNPGHVAARFAYALALGLQPGQRMTVGDVEGATTGSLLVAFALFLSVALCPAADVSVSVQRPGVTSRDALVSQQTGDDGGGGGGGRGRESALPLLSSGAPPHGSIATDLRATRQHRHWLARHAAASRLACAPRGRIATDWGATRRHRH
jgi:hypothetical protein